MPGIVHRPTHICRRIPYDEGVYLYPSKLWSRAALGVVVSCVFVPVQRRRNALIKVLDARRLQSFVVIHPRDLAVADVALVRSNQLLDPVEKVLIPNL